MPVSPSIVLTNDDGIEAPGLLALRDHLRERDDVGEVTVVAPREDESGAGVMRSWTREELVVDDHPEGYAVRGTPADCVAVAVEVLGLGPDAVVSGCNDGPNLGAHILARSGTIGAAMEAALLGYPAIAASVFDPEYEAPPEYGREDFRLAVRVVGDLLAPFLAGERFPAADYLNVNAPEGGADGAGPAVRVTRPSSGYHVEFSGDPAAVLDAESEGAVELRDRFWREFLDMEPVDPPGTDRRACVDGEVSVSPLSVPAAAAPERVGDVVRGVGPSGESE